jgi:ribosomal protein S6
MSPAAARQYEAVFIYQIGDENVSIAKTFVTDEFKGSSVKILKEQDLGEKTLAFEI